MRDEHLTALLLWRDIWCSMQVTGRCEAIDLAAMHLDGDVHSIRNDRVGRIFLWRNETTIATYSLPFDRQTLSRLNIRCVLGL